MLTLVTMDTFGSRIQRKRREAGLSQDALGDKAGVSGVTINNWENGITKDPYKINRKSLAKAARALDTTEEFLLEGKGPEKPERYLAESSTSIEAKDVDELDDILEVALPVLDLRLSAGPGATGEEHPVELEKIIFQRSWLKKNRLKQEDLRVLTVEGESMKPILWPGDKVVVNIGQNKVIDGRVFALAYGEDLRVKRLFRRADGAIRIISVNDNAKEYPEEVVSPEEIEGRISVIGQVVHKMGNGGL